MTQYLIATSVLEAIARGSLADDARLRVHSTLPFARPHAMDVGVQGQECRVTAHLDARLGENLPALAEEARFKIGRALARMTGLTVTSVDIVFAGVFPSDSR